MSLSVCLFVCLSVSDALDFCRAMLCISAAYAVMQCVSVCVSVTFVDHVKTNKHIFKNFLPSGSHTILVFPYQTGWRYSDGNSPNGGVECRWGIGRNHDSGLIAGYQRWTCVVPKTFTDDEAEYMTQSATQYAPLAIDRFLDGRTTKRQKQLPTTMQCRSHSRRRTVECLFVTACSMDEYAEQNQSINHSEED